MRRHSTIVLVGGLLVGVVSFTVIRPDVTPPTARAMTPVTTVTSVALPSKVETTITSSIVTSTTAAPVTSLVIQGVGDVNFDPLYITEFADAGYEIAFAGIDGLFHEDDLTVINLECPPTDVGTQLDKDYSFRCDPAALPIAASAGIDVANLANNHGQDRGVEGMLDAVANLSAAGIAPVGVGSDAAEANAPALFDIGGRTVAVLGMGGVVPGDSWLATEDGPGMADGDDIGVMTAAVARAAEIADVVVVTIHWGRELVVEPDEGDRARAEAMVEAGADVIFGHHPHRLGELAFVDGAPVFWTLGNFVWPKLSIEGATTAVARVVIEPTGEITACLLPAFIESSGQPVLTGDRRCEGEL
ncbi:MAG: CapA family protein [Acidimicrobiia bacterium]|nr:CapA family protein [Acidimicrobiia bacterium]